MSILVSNMARCFFSAARMTFGAQSDEELCEKLDLRYSYGSVDLEEFSKAYNPAGWQVRKVSWILEAPLDLVLSTAVLGASFLLCKKEDETKGCIFVSARLLEHAAGSILCIFNDKVGMHWHADASAHTTLYTMACVPIAERKIAYVNSQ